MTVVRKVLSLKLRDRAISQESKLSKRFKTMQEMRNLCVEIKRKNRFHNLRWTFYNAKINRNIFSVSSVIFVLNEVFYNEDHYKNL